MASRLGSPFAAELGAIPFEPAGDPPVITPVTLGTHPPGCVNFSVDIPVTNSPVTWSIVAGALPVGYDVGEGAGGPSTGAVFGTSTVPGVYTFTIRATNAAGHDDWATSMTIGAFTAPGIDTTPPTSPVAVGDFYDFQFLSTTDFDQCCSVWSVVAGALPPGISIVFTFIEGCEISGTPTTAGTFNFTLRSENGAGFAEQSFTIVVADHVWVGSDPTTYAQTGAFEIGTLFTLTSSISIVGVRIWNPGLGAHSGRSAKLWAMPGAVFISSGTKVREVTLPDQMPTGWSEYLFSTPYPASTANYLVMSYDVGGFGLDDIGHVTWSTAVDSADGKVHIPASNPGCYTPTVDSCPAINFINEFWGIDVLYLDSVSGGTATPAAITLAATVPAPTVTGGGAGGGTATPAAIALAAVTPAPTTSGTSNTTPAAITRTVVTPAPLFPPVNDNFAAAIALSNGVRVTTSRGDATAEGGETGTATLWWKFTTTAAGPVSVNTIGSTYDTILRVYTGASIGALTLIASDDDSGGSFTSLLSFAGAAATTYYVQVSNGAFSFVGSSISVQATWPIAAVALTVVVPAPTVTGGGAGDGNAAPATITRTVVVPAPTVSGGSANGTATPAAITRTVVVPAPTAAGVLSANPAAIALHAVVPAPTATGTIGAVLAATWGPLTGVTVATVSHRIEAVLVASW